MQFLDKVVRGAAGVFLDKFVDFPVTCRDKVLLAAVGACRFCKRCLQRLKEFPHVPRVRRPLLEILDIASTSPLYWQSLPPIHVTVNGSFWKNFTVFTFGMVDGGLES